MPSHCVRACSSKKFKSTSAATRSDEGTPKDWWSPPPVSASRRDDPKFLVNATVCGSSRVNAVMVTICSRDSKERAWSFCLCNDQRMRSMFGRTTNLLLFG
ncbi:hypothetical protein ACMFMF_004225 [Clarireedia jacksonii]